MIQHTVCQKDPNASALGTYFLLFSQRIWNKLLNIAKSPIFFRYQIGMMITASVP